MPTDPRDVVEHLRYYADLGVEGFSRDRAWRARASAPSRAAAVTPAPEPRAEPASPPLAPHVTAPARSRVEALAIVRTDLGECTRCKLHKGRIKLVFGTGNAEARLMFVGEGPGAEEDEQGLPFVGRAGQLLTQIIKAMGWPEPVYAHIPLIHGADGAKLSKRHGALGVDAYRDMGFLPEALRNYLLRLGWGHGDDEIISTKQAIEWFDLPGVGRSPSRFDTVKLTNLNAHYLREAPDAELLPLVLPRIELKLGRAIDAAGMARIERGMNGVKQRSRTVIELADNLVFYASAGAPPIADDKARAQLTPDSKALLTRLATAFDSVNDWSEKPLEEAVRRFAEAENVKLGQVAQPLRVALSGSTASPGIFEVVAILGPAETKARLLAAGG